MKLFALQSIYAKFKKNRPRNNVLNLPPFIPFNLLRSSILENAFISGFLHDKTKLLTKFYIYSFGDSG